VSVSDFDGFLREMRAAFKRRDCEGARNVVRKIMGRRNLTEGQRATLLKLQHAVRTCERRPGLGRPSRRSRRRKTRR
jgi:hypothetical protein